MEKPSAPFHTFGYVSKMNGAPAEGGQGRRAPGGFQRKFAMIRNVMEHRRGVNPLLFWLRSI